MLFVETPIFTREVHDLIPDDDYRNLQLRFCYVPRLEPLFHVVAALEKFGGVQPEKGNGAGYE